MADFVDDLGRPYPTLASLGKPDNSSLFGLGAGLAGGKDFLSLLGQTWPAQMGRSVLDALALPGDVYAGRVDPMSDRGIGRAADLAGLVMGGTFAGAPAGSVGAGFVRRTRGASPDTGTGHMMFVKDSKADKVAHYGSNLWGFKSDAVPAAEILDAASPKFRRGAYRALRELEDRGTARALVDEANPTDIVNSAGLWDNLDYTAHLWDKVLEPRGIRAITTQDGAIVFDPSLVTRIP